MENTEALANLFSQDVIFQWVRALLVMIIGVVIARLTSRGLYRVTEGPMGLDTATILRRFSFYILVVVTLMTALREIGFSLSVVIGAAGILSVAIGFASQTSASNLISGVFLVAEKSFRLGDIIKVGDITGEVLSIDLLSVKLRQFDNVFVRVPNETLIKSNISNLSRFPIRRLDLQIGVAYKEDIARVRDVLMAVAESYPLCLDQPVPLVIFQGFGDSSLNLQLSIWAARENFLALRNEMPEAIKRAFDEEGIEIPFPQRSVNTGSQTTPFPIEIITRNESE